MGTSGVLVLFLTHFVNSCVGGTTFSSDMVNTAYFVEEIAPKQL